MIDTGLKDKVVLITGANHGIGEATARAFAVQEAVVAIHYLGPAKGGEVDDHQNLHVNAGIGSAEALMTEILASGGRAMTVEGDLADPQTFPALFDRIEAAFGRVDVVVNNAAHCEAPDTIFTVTAGTFDRTFDVNARGMMLMSAEFTRRLQARNGTWGRIISLSTDAAQTFSGQITYGASKATIEAFTRSLADELGPLGITVNTIAPGPVQTGYITPALEEQLRPTIPLRRIGQPDDIADVIVFLASEQARWLTGQVIRVSGGHVM